MCLGSVCIEDCKRTQQPPALLSEEETDFGVFGSGCERREGCSGRSLDSGANAVPTFLTPYRVFLCVCVCVCFKSVLHNAKMRISKFFSFRT